MKRRTLLGTLGSIGLAGCSSSGPSEATSQTQTTRTTKTTTRSPTTATTTSPPPDPEIQDINILYYWDEFGDVRDNAVESIGKGGPAVVGIRYTLPVHDGKSEELVQSTIYHEGVSVNSRSVSDTRLSSTSTGSEAWERWFSFGTSEWETGTYTAEALVRDEISGQNSNAAEIEFDLVEPLNPDEAELSKIEQPPTIKTGDRVKFTLHLRNTSDRDSSVVSTLSSRYEDSKWQTYDEKFRLNVAAGSTRSWESGEMTFSYAGTYTYRLDAINSTWTVEVQE